MDKEKQIEEIAKIMRLHICKDRPCKECDCHGLGDKTSELYHCDCYYYAKSLVKQGYQKITDSVVLSREEYSELKGRAEEVFNEMTERMKAEVKIAKKMGIVKGSKETADKILNDISDLEIVDDKVCAYELASKLNKLEKQFNVEIKES